MKTLHTILVSCLILGISCTPKSTQQEKQTAADNPIESIKFANAREQIETVCIVCHSATAMPDKRFAPPLEIAKRNYLAQTETKQEFVDKMVRFILNPTVEQSLLHSDVEQFGVMDPVGFSQEDVTAIAEFIYETNLEKPSWLLDQ